MSQKQRISTRRPKVSKANRNPGYKNIIAEMENFLESFNIRFDQEEKRISKLKQGQLQLS